MRVEQSGGWRPGVAWLLDAVRDVSNEGDVARVHPPPPSVSDSEIAAIADFHGVPGFARLAAPGAHPALDSIVHQAQARHLRAMSDLALVVEALEAAGVGFLVVKGPALVATCYAGPHLRSYVDLDLLVRPRYLRAAVVALAEVGFSVLDANWPVLTAYEVRELRLEGPTGGALDLHWSLSPGPGDQDTAPPADRLIGRAVTATVGPVTFPIPCPTDLAVHVTVHAASSGGHRLVWFTDLRGALGRALKESSSGDLLDTAREWQALTGLSLMARRTNRLLGTDLPGELSGPWPQRVWAGVDAAASALAPPERAGEGSSPSRLLARSSRSSVPASLRAVAHKAWNWARSGRLVPPGRDLMHDPSNPLSALYPAGGSQGAEAFYARVAEQDTG